MSLLSDRDPTVVRSDQERKVVFWWTVRRIEDHSDPAALTVNLTVWHDKVGKALRAELRNATRYDRGATVEAFWADDAVWTRRQFAGRYSKTGLYTFAEQTLAELRQADAAGDDLHVDLAEHAPREQVDSDRRTPDADTRETPALTAAREAFFDTRNVLRAVLEDLIEAETRAVHKTAADLTVEVYNDELAEPRGRLVTVNTAGQADQPDDALAERIADLLDEWAVAADTDCTEIVFSVLPPDTTR